MRVFMRVMTAHEFGCVMVPLPEALASDVRDLAYSIPESDLFQGNGDAVPDFIHVTVRYGLKCGLDDVLDVLDGVGAGTVTLTGLSVFHNDDCAVLKVNVRSGFLERMNRMLAVLPHVDTHPVYRPHVTVAYLRHRKDDPYWYREFREKHSKRFEGKTFSFERALFSEPSGREMWIELWRPDLDWKRLREMAGRIASAEMVTAKIVR